MDGFYDLLVNIFKASVVLYVPALVTVSAAGIVLSLVLNAFGVQEKAVYYVIKLLVLSVVIYLTLPYIIEHLSYLFAYGLSGGKA